jgi:hypothetical protein
MRSSIRLVLLGAALQLSTLATPINYTINFSLASGTIAPTSGSFTYDPDVGFSNFIVVWDGITFDLTASANAPLVAYSICGASTPATAFLLLSQSTPCSVTNYYWGGSDDFHDTFYFLGTFLPLPGGMYQIYNLIGFTNTAGSDAVGTWSIPGVSTPEPATLDVMLLAGFAFAGIRKAYPMPGACGRRLKIPGVGAVL